MTHSTFGPAYDEKIDGKRIGEQLGAIKRLMQGGQWRTLREIANLTGYPESSISAQLRHLRKDEFGSYRIEKQRRGAGGTWEYRMLDPLPVTDTTQPGLF